MENNQTEKSLSFTKEDFFNQYEMKNFVAYLSNLQDIDSYMKKAIIDRTMIETQGENPEVYSKLMGYIQSKGIEHIIQLIEKRDDQQPVNTKEVEKIVHRILNERNITSISVIREDEIEMKDANIQHTPIGERKRASNKLKDL